MDFSAVGENGRFEALLGFVRIAGAGVVKLGMSQESGGRVEAMLLD